MKAHYSKTINTIEKWTTYSFNVMLKMIFPTFITPTIFSTIYKYFILHLSRDSFKLLYPASLVQSKRINTFNLVIYRLF